MPKKKAKTSKSKLVKVGKGRPGKGYIKVYRGNGVWDWIKGAANTVYNKAIKPAYNFAKDTKALSTIAGLIPHSGAKVVSAGLRAVGLGRGKGKKGCGRQIVKGGGAAPTDLQGRLFLT